MSVDDAVPGVAVEQPKRHLVKCCDPEWRALCLEFLAHAARDRSFRRAFARRTDETRAALEEAVVERAGLVDEDAPGMSPEEGLWAHHMLHG